MSSAIFQQVVDATRGEYVLHGTLGRSDALGNAFLAGEVATGRSVLLVVAPAADSLDVVGALSETIPADAGGCAACGFRVGTWVDECPRCEHPLLPPPGPSPEVAVLRDQVSDTLHVVGSLPHVRGGTMYFATEVGDGRLAAFVVRPQLNGQLGLEVVWEAALDAPVVSSRPSDYEGSDDAGVPRYTNSTPNATVPEYAAEYDDAPGRGVEPAFDPPASRRAWLPIGAGVGAVALIGAAAFAFTRGGTPTRVPPVTPDTAAPILLTGSAPTVPAVSTAGASTLGGGTSAPPVKNDSLRAVDSARAARRRWRDSVRAVADARLRDAATLTIDDSNLPTGWTVSVNGSGVSNNREVPLVVGAPAVIRIEAPGYCADTLTVTPSPKSRKHWAPTLRGSSIAGSC